MKRKTNKKLERLVNSNSSKLARFNSVNDNHIDVIPEDYLVNLIHESMHMDMSDGSDTTVYGSTCVATVENPDTVTYEDLMALAIEMDAAREPNHVTRGEVVRCRADMEMEFGIRVNSNLAHLVIGKGLI